MTSTILMTVAIITTLHWGDIFCIEIATLPELLKLPADFAMENFLPEFLRILLRFQFLYWRFLRILTLQEHPQEHNLLLRIWLRKFIWYLDLCRNGTIKCFGFTLRFDLKVPFYKWPYTLAMLGIQFWLRFKLCYEAIAIETFNP